MLVDANCVTCKAQLAGVQSVLTSLITVASPGEPK
jgi:hypothetical protein